MTVIVEGENSPAVVVSQIAVESGDGGAAPGPSAFSFWAALLGLLAIVVLVGAESWLATRAHYRPVAGARIWSISALLIVLFMVGTGHAINNRPAGLLIDNRNRVSLSKFQAACWTVLVVSTLATMAAARIATGVADPVNVTIPGELLAALGLSVTSLVATPALLSLKANSPQPTSSEVQATANKLGMSSVSMDVSGRVFGRINPALAEWLDMFRGEDVSNAAAPDLSKIQQFLFTLLVIGVYAAAILDMFLVQAQANTLILAPQGSLPPLTANFVWLLGISHASYLAYKAAPHGPPAGPVTGT